MDPKHDEHDGHDDNGHRSTIKFLRECVLSAAGATLFALPLLMTAEMWQIGIYMDRWRLALFMLVGFTLLVGLSIFAGFEKHRFLRDDIIDAVVAYAIGIAVATFFLNLFSVIEWSMPVWEITGLITIQAVPASIGAILARNQLGKTDEERKKRAPSYGGELFLMVGGAIFIGLNIAPNDEIAMLAHKMSLEQGIALGLLSLILLHLFVYHVGFKGQEARPENLSLPGVFLKFSLAGYGLALVISLYILWTYGRTDDTAPQAVAMMTLVLGFPSALGAATARLII